MPNAHPEPGSLVGIDGSLIDGALSMPWADYRKGSKKKILSQNPVPADSIVFFDATVLPGTADVNQGQTPLRLVGHAVDRVKYWIATNRYDLTAEQIARAYKLRWDIENFFAWWKRHLKVYHLIARSAYGLMVQILAGLITYLSLAIHCHLTYAIN